jgi:hypothetical protein
MKISPFLLLLLVLSRFTVSGADSQELQIALKEARDLAKEGDYAAALDKHVWYHEHSRGTAHTGVRLSFAMSDWVNLGEQFPPAKEKLLGIRDQQEKALMTGKGGFTEYTEVSAIDRVFKQQDKTYQMLGKLFEKSPEVAKKCFFGAADMLIERKDYPLFLELADAPMNWLRRNTDILQLWQQQDNKRALDSHLTSIAKQGRQYLEALSGVGEHASAETLHKDILALTKDQTYETALAVARERAKAKK